jgi:hypothetical protein
VGAARTVRVLEPQAERAIQADVGEPDQRQRDGKAGPGDDPDQGKDGGGQVGVGQVVGQRAGPPAPQVPEQAQVGCRQQRDKQPPGPPIPAIQQDRHDQQRHAFAAQQQQRQTGHQPGTARARQ